MNNILFFTTTILLLCCIPVTGYGQANELFLSSDPVYQRILVKEVVSADTIVLENDEEVVLIGLKAPLPPEREKIERDQFGFVVENVTPLQTLEEKALNFTKGLLDGKYVRLEFDSQKRDKKILLAYVYLAESDLFINAEILRQGFASLSLSAPNLKYADQLRAAYQEARTEKRGLEGE